MSDATSSLQPSSLDRFVPGQSLTPERIDHALEDFRTWLQYLDTIPEFDTAPVDSIDLHTLVSQFTALRHEVNLQTKSTRAMLDQGSAAIEQNQTTLEQLEEVVDELRAATGQPDQGLTLKPLLKPIVDVYDALALALRQVTRQRDSLNGFLAQLEEPIVVDALPELPKIPEPQQEEKPSFWRRLFSPRPVAPPSDDIFAPLLAWQQSVVSALRKREEDTKKTTNLLRQALEGLITGYTMSLNRIDRLFPQVELEAMQSVGQPFDPETMEVVEVVLDSGVASGSVVEENRRGYRFRGEIYRYAQVRVAK